MDRAYEDLLSDRIWDEFWTRRSAEWDIEIATIDGELSRLERQNVPSVVSAEKILELAKRARNSLQIAESGRTAATARGVNDLYRKPSSRPGDEEVLLESSQHKRPLGFSQDGHFLLYREFGETTGWNLLALPLSTGGTPIPIAQSSFEERNGQFSPDGRWVAFDSNESGRSEIYVQPFPGIGSKVPVSAGGGAQPRWRRDGHELFYIGLDGQVMATPIRLGSDGRTVDPGSPVTLFATRIAGGPMTSVNKHQYVAAPDGQRFLINVDEEEPRTPPIRLILNWKLPTGQ